MKKSGRIADKNNSTSKEKTSEEKHMVFFRTNRTTNSSIETKRKTYSMSLFSRSYRTLGLGLSILVLGGCLGNFVSYYKNLDHPDTTTPVFVPDVHNRLHLPSVDSSITSMAETNDSHLIVSTLNGWLQLDQNYQVVESFLFDQQYATTTVFNWNDSFWIYGVTNQGASLTKNEHHLYRLNSTLPLYSFVCNSRAFSHFFDDPIVDLNNDGQASLMILCQDDSLRAYAVFLSLEDGTVSTVQIPFQPIVPIIGTTSNDRRSLYLMADLPRMLFLRDIDTPTPVYRSLDLPRMNRVIVAIEESSPHVYSKRFTSLSEFTSLSRLSGKSNAWKILVVDNSRELLRSDLVYPGRILLQWKLDGTLANWWYFDLKRNFREIHKWFELPQIPAGNEQGVILSVLKGWGHWCQWNPCGSGIVLLRPNGEYKMIDFTTSNIDSIHIANDGRILASWNGMIYEYTLESLQMQYSWKSSIIPTEQLAWISKRSGLLETEIRERFKISDEQDVGLEK